MRSFCIAWLIALLPSVAWTQGSAVSWCTLYGDYGYAFAGGSAVASMVGDVAAGPMTAGNTMIVAGFLGNRLTWGGVTWIGDGSTEVPVVAELMQNFPNPFNPSTTIRYGLAQRSHATVTVFSALGEQVAVLVEGEQQVGYHEVRFDGSGLASGVYFYRLRAGAFSQTRKLVLLR